MKKHFSEVISFLLIIFLLILSSVSFVAAVQDSTAIPIAYVLTDGTYNYRIQYDQLLTSYISYRSNTEATAARLAKFYFDTLNQDISGLVAYQSGNTQKYVGYADILSKYVSTRNINTTYTWFNGDSSTAAFTDWTEVKLVGSDGVISGRLFVGSDGLTGVVKTELNTAISSANSNFSTTAVSTDGADVNTTDMWVSQPVKTTYSDAISAAQAVADNPGVTQQQADDALAAMNNATNTFNAAKSSGTNIPVIEINITGESTVVIDNTLQLDVVITPSNATRKAILWTVEPVTGTATISETGLLTATVIGTVTVTATNAVSGVTGTKVITIISELDAAKAAAHDALTTALATYTQSDYSEANWTTLTGFKTAGDTAIDAATNLAGVASAKDTAIAGMAGVETIAETLAAAKVSAHEALANALATYTQSDYTPANWTTLTGFKTDGDTAIDAATDLAGVTSAKDTAIAGMAGVETIAETLAAAKAAAHDALTAALATYTQSDYTPANWTTLTGFKTAGDTAIDAAADLDGVASAKDTAIAGMAGVEKIAETLAAAKTAAHNALTTALATYTQSAYTPANWTTLTGFKTDGDTAIDAATDLAGVISARDTAIAGMAGVETIAETLAAAKSAAHNALTTELATYTQSDYSPANWTTLTGFKTAGDTAIDAATDLAGVASAKDTAIAGMAGVETIAETLAAAKVTAHSALTTEMAKYTQSDYTPANWTTLTGFKTAGDTAIDAATDLAGVTSAQDTAINGMAGVETIAETSAAKAAAHDALTTALATYTQSDYTPANWTTLTGFKTAGDTAIDAATDLAGVTSARDTAIAGMAGVETIAETLAAAKVTAHGVLTTELATYTESNYTPANWTTLTGFKTAGDTAIDAATDLAGVTSARDTAIAGMAGVETIAETLAAAKVTAHGVLTTELAKYTESNYTTDNWTTLTGFKTAGDTAIDAATDLTGVDSARDTAIAGMAGVETIAETLAAAKVTAHGVLTTELATYTESNYTPANWTTLTGFKTAGDTAIDAATDLAAVDSARDTAIAGMAGVETIAETLTAAKVTAHGVLTTELATYTESNYTTDNWTTLTGFKTAGDTAIGNATDLAAVDSARDTAIAGMAGIETIAETLTAAKVTAHGVLTTELATYTESNYTTDNWTTLTGFKTAGDTAIGNATDLAAVDSARDTAIAGMDGVQTIDEALTAAKAAEAALDPVNYVDYSAVTAALAMPETTNAEKTAKTDAINAAIAALVLI